MNFVFCVNINMTSTLDEKSAHQRLKCGKCAITVTYIKCILQE